MDEKNTIRVGQTILAGKFDDLFPSFTICPEDLEFADTPKVAASPKLVELEKKLFEKIQNYCMARNGHPRTRALTPAMQNIVNKQSEKMRQRVLDSVNGL